MPRPNPGPRVKATMLLHPSLWHRFKACCAALNIVPGHGIDSLMAAWLAQNEPDAHRQLEEESPQ